MDELDDAAAAALLMLTLEQDPSREHMGALFAAGDRISRTDTITRGGRSGVRGTLSVPAGALRGLFHNHPGDDEDDYYRGRFSEDDKAQAKRAGVPSYISAGDRVLKYNPKGGDTSEVLAAFPWDEFRAHLMRTVLGRAPDDPRGLTR